MIASPESQSVSTTPARRRGEAHDFDRRLLGAVRRCTQGEPAALLHLDIAGAWDVRDAGGQAAVNALRDAINELLAGHLSSPIVCSPDGLCGFSVLFENTGVDDAVDEATALKHDVDRLRFHWHGHPFRISAWAGLLELGAEPARARYWLGNAREACAAARELSGSGIQVVELNDHAWGEIARNREWVRYLSEILC